MPAGKATEAVQEADADKLSETGRAAASYVPPKWAGVPEGWVSPSCWTSSPSWVTKPLLLGSVLRPCCSLREAGQLRRSCTLQHISQTCRLLPVPHCCLVSQLTAGQVPFVSPQPSLQAPACPAQMQACLPSTSCH